VDIVFSKQAYLHDLIQHIFHTGYAKDRPCSPLLVSSRRFNQMQPTYRIVREVHIAYHRYSTGAFHVLIRIGPDEQRGTRLKPLQGTFFREVVTEGLSFHALEEEPVLHVELQCPENVLSCEQATIEQMLKKEEETRFVFLLQTASNTAYCVCLAISYP
jgi:hypothetical protein